MAAAERFSLLSAAASLWTSSRVARDLFCHPPVAAPLQRGPLPRLPDERARESFGVVEDYGLAPAGDGGADRNGIFERLSTAFERSRTHRDKHTITKFEPRREGFGPDGEDVQV